MLCLICETNDCSENVSGIPLCESCATNYMTCENCGDPSPVTAIETFMVPGENKPHCIYCPPPEGLDEDQHNEWFERESAAYEENLEMYRKMYGRIKPYYLLSFEILSDPDNVYSKFTVNKLFDSKFDLDYFIKIHAKGLVSKFRITTLDDLRETELIDKFYSIVERVEVKTKNKVKRRK